MIVIIYKTSKQETFCRAQLDLQELLEIQAGMDLR